MAADTTTPEDRVAQLTAALEAERRRRGEVEARHRLLVESARDYVIILLDPEGRVASWNDAAAALTGYRGEEILGRHFSMLFAEEDRGAGVPERELRQAASGRGVEDENWAVRKDGSRFWASGRTTACRDEQGGFVGFVEIFRDLTERRRAEEEVRRSRDELERRVEERTAELRAAQRQALRAERLAAVGRVVAVLAHESHSALQRSQACLERLAWRLRGQPEALDLVARARRAQDDLGRLYGDLRGFATPVRLDCRPCDLAGVWRQAWAEAAAQRPGRTAALDEHTSGVDLRVDGDAFRLGQVFRNLFDNSLAAGPGPVRVVVAAAAAELSGAPAVRLSVRDNGPGLGPEQRGHAFEPFYTTKANGTGLGMAIAKNIVEAHGGRIALGEGPGPGAEILLTLPRRQP